MQFKNSSFFNIYRKLLFFNELINISALFTATKTGNAKGLLLTAIECLLCKRFSCIKGEIGRLRN